MTRKIIALGIVLVAVFSVITLSGCKKEEPAAPQDEVEKVVEDVMNDAAAEDHTGHDHD